MQIQIKNPKDFWAGLMFIAFGLFFVAWTLGTPAWLNAWFGKALIPGYQMGTAVRMGPGYFPVLLGGLLAVLGAMVFAESLMVKPAADASPLSLPFNIIDLVIFIAVFAVCVWIARAAGVSPDYGMLAGATIVSVLAILYRPDARALVLLSAACVFYGYLMKPLGLVAATIALVFISAFGGHEFKWKEVTILTAVLLVMSVLVFVKGLTLPFPICPQFVELCPIR